MRGVPEVPAGLTVRPDLLTSEEEGALLGWVAGLPFEHVVMRGVSSRRRVCHFGAGYDFDARAATPGEPLPAQLQGLRERAAAFAAVAPGSLAEALVTEYAAGATIGWHKDAQAFGSVVVGVSLASDAVMRFQRRAAGGERRVHEQPLPRRSAYVLTGAARWTWQHSIPSVSALRYSVTFRQLRQD